MMNGKVCILLGVWGEKFINAFLQLGLPSLLAPGNIPALAAVYKTKFVFLTKSKDIDVFQNHPSFKTLERYCDIQFIPIEDLIVFGNYSTTLTFAYDRAIKRTGSEMLTTYFIFLTSDYIMADGSLQGLMRYIEKGYTGICAGNFQVIREEVEPFLLSHIDHDKNILQITPRELLAHSLLHLHTISIASIYNQQVIHNYYANRLFFRQDHQVLAGRFYLLHMLCIKPETMNYNVGASCDYSFIPEMCPSGNIAIIDDSDDYLVVEVQPKEHELDFVDWGPYHFKKLSYALGEWTTKQHRMNANKTIYFHATDITQQEKAVIETEFDKLIGTIGKNLSKYKEKPHYNHPYWLGASLSFEKQQSLIKNNKACEYIDLTTVSQFGFFKRLFYRFFGKPPIVFRWHPFWREYRYVMRFMKEQIPLANRKSTIVLYDSYQWNFMWYCSWLKEYLHIAHHYHVKNLLDSPDKLSELQATQFENAMLFVRVDDFKNVRDTLKIIKTLVKPSGKVFIFVPNDKNQHSHVSYNFQGEFAYKINYVVGSEYHILNVTTIHDNFRLLATKVVVAIYQAFLHNKKMRFLFYVLLGLPGSIICLIRNCLPSINKKKGHCTNIILTLMADKKTEIEHEG